MAIGLPTGILSTVHRAKDGDPQARCRLHRGVCSHYKLRDLAIFARVGNRKCWSGLHLIQPCANRPHSLFLLERSRQGQYLAANSSSVRVVSESSLDAVETRPCPLRLEETSSLISGLHCRQPATKCHSGFVFPGTQGQFPGILNGMSSLAAFLPASV